MASHNGSRVNGSMTTLLPITVRCGGSSATSRTDPVQRMSAIAKVADSLRRNSSSVQEASATAPTQSRMITLGQRVVISARQSLPNRRPHRGNPTWVLDQARYWYSPEGAGTTRHTVGTAQAGGAKSAVAAQAFRSSGAPDGSLSEAVAVYGVVGRCQDT